MREQVQAYRHVMGGTGWLGWWCRSYRARGKSTMLGGGARGLGRARVCPVSLAALFVGDRGRKAWKEGGGIAQPDGGGASFYQWEQGREELTKRDVLVVDEAGMIGSRHFESLLAHDHTPPGRRWCWWAIRFVEAIEAGAAFRAIAERVGAVTLPSCNSSVPRGSRRRRASSRRAARPRRSEPFQADGDGARARHRWRDAEAALVAGWEGAHSGRMPPGRRVPNSGRSCSPTGEADVRHLNDRARAVRRAAGQTRGPVLEARSAGSAPLPPRGERGLYSCGTNTSSG